MPGFVLTALLSKPEHPDSCIALSHKLVIETTMAGVTQHFNLKQNDGSVQCVITIRNNYKRGGGFHIILLFHLFIMESIFFLTH